MACGYSAAPGDLEFGAGAIIAIVSNAPGHGWSTGRFRELEGVFPTTYVEEVFSPQQQQENRRREAGGGAFTPAAGTVGDLSMHSLRPWQPLLSRLDSAIQHSESVLAKTRSPSPTEGLDETSMRP